MSLEDLRKELNPRQQALRQALTGEVDKGAVIQAGQGVVAYWGRRDVSGLLLMPPTRHTIVHLNEARRLTKRLD